jgi:hypothetical protein
MTNDERDDEDPSSEPPSTEDLLNLYDRVWREHFGDPGAAARDRARRFGVELSQEQERIGATYEHLRIGDLVAGAWEHLKADPDAGPWRAATRALKDYGPEERLDPGAVTYLLTEGLASALLHLMNPPGEPDEPEP